MENNNYPELFVPGKDWQNNACLNYDGDISYHYISGYKMAANQLVKHAIEAGNDQDILVYPITFLYRQHLELLLKKIIIEGSYLLEKEIPKLITHSLNKIWSLAQPVIKEIFSNEIEEDEFKKIDNNATSFRYSENKDGQKSLRGLMNINLRHLYICIESVSELLEDVLNGIEELKFG